MLGAKYMKEQNAFETLKNTLEDKYILVFPKYYGL
jgi:hypothetical protein